MKIMLEKLNEIKNILPELIIQKAKDGLIKTLYIDYHPPFVSRVWFQHGDYRVFLHKIEPCNESIEALYHPHKWDSAMEILEGSYEMGIGHSETNETPKTDCKLILKAGTQYEMTEKNGWHYVNPLEQSCYTLMITGALNQREMPIEPSLKFRTLKTTECYQILCRVNFDKEVNIAFLSNSITGESFL